MIKMYAVGMLGSYLTQGVYAIAGPFQPFGGAVDIIVVEQEDGTFKSSPWYVKFGDFQGVLKRQEKIVDISVNDVGADFHMILDSKGEAYFEKEVEQDEGAESMSSKGSSSSEESPKELEQETEVGTDSLVSAHIQLNEACSVDSLHEEGKVYDESLLGSRDEEVISDVDNQLGAENGQVKNKLCSIKDTETDTDNDFMDMSRAEEEAQGKMILSCSGSRVTQENSGVVSGIVNPLGLSDSESFQTVRGSDYGSIEKREIVFQGWTNFSMEQVNLQNPTLSDAETTEKFVGTSNQCVEDDSLLVEMWAEDTFESLEVHCNDENRPEVNVDEDETFTAGFKCMTIEGERESLLYCSSGVQDELGIGEDTVSVDIQSYMSPTSSDVVVVPLSQSSNGFVEDGPKNGTVGTVPSEKEEEAVSNAANDAGIPAVSSSVSSSSPPSKWRFWPPLLRWSRIEKASSLSNQALVAAANVAMKSPLADNLVQKNGYIKWKEKPKVRTYVPTSAQLASLHLQDGPNKVTFTFSSVLGKTQVDARIYLWKWHTRIVISDVDGTITKSDVLGQVMPLVGRDWSQYGVTRLFSAIKDNGYEVLFLSARAISQAYLTRRFLLNLKQDGEALPEGPVFISPDGLIPSLYREVIRRAPHEFKISCLEGIRDLFPTDVNPFYAGFGNRITDEISYLKVGIPKGKIFIINPKGEVVVNHRVDCKSYTSLHALVDEMFPPMSSHESEEYNEWNFWKVPLPDIEDELCAKSSKSLKKVGSSKK
ncbi:hypothetical protein KP509_21G035700 [Ceratopteris richardii]|uniref:LNS2/PITP domain-containing protein n=1 Tax=Ceratopteris richardii TaxID=49495 RepID=A0A8T2SAV0_CERRI|nr:hypothetical protein KP509_21G035700 [Ceratopteris richardii]KAH7315130.1 hypothetical protein KP509_21G035700 [Ceratopteris richardii]KAH7315131.1 hypothetical protein KP509_21G035700 [Ceratopteris richardii]